MHPSCAHSRPSLRAQVRHLSSGDCLTKVSSTNGCSWWASPMSMKADADAIGGTDTRNILRTSPVHTHTLCSQQKLAVQADVAVCW